MTRKPNKPKKPRLTSRIVRGLGSVYALADVNQYDESDLYKGCKTEAERHEINNAIAWLGSLLHWYSVTHQPKETP